MVITVASGGPDWATIMTAFGAVAAAVAAVSIALWVDWRSGVRIKAEHDLGDARLAREQAHSRALLEEEQRAAREREQLAEAYAVQVVLAEKDAGPRDEVYGEPVDESVRQLVALIVNRGAFTITRVEAQFSYDGMSLVAHRRHERLSGFVNVPERLRAGWGRSPERAMYGVLTPWDEGVRFESDKVHVQNLTNPYPLVRWMDRWGTRWEHRLGEVRQIRDGQDWAP